LWSGGFVAVGVFACRGVFGDAAEDPMLLILEGVTPALLFAVALALERWFGGAVEDAPDRSMRAIRIALTAGCSAFVLHNFVSYSLWTPGTASLFWVALGTAAAGAARGVSLRRSAIPAALMGIIGVVAVTVIFVSPVAQRLNHTRRAADALLRRDPSRAIREAERAAQCDPLDSYAAMNASRFCLVSGMHRRRQNAAGVLLPMAWAQEAMRRNDDANAYRLAAQAAWELRLPEADRYWEGAIRRDPADSRLRLDYAAWLVDHHRIFEAEAQLNEAETIDRRLRAFNPESVYLFSQNEQKRIADLRRRIDGK
jgi:hypothetical protein